MAGDIPQKETLKATLEVHARQDLEALRAKGFVIDAAQIEVMKTGFMEWLKGQGVTEPDQLAQEGEAYAQAIKEIAKEKAYSKEALDKMVNKPLDRLYAQSSTSNMEFVDKAVSALERVGIKRDTLASILGFVAEYLDSGNDPKNKLFSGKLKAIASYLNPKLKDDKGKEIKPTPEQQEELDFKAVTASFESFKIPLEMSKNDLKEYKKEHKITDISKTVLVAMKQDTPINLINKAVQELKLPKLTGFKFSIWDADLSKEQGEFVVGILNGKASKTSLAKDIKPNELESGTMRALLDDVRKNKEAKPEMLAQK